MNGNRFHIQLVLSSINMSDELKELSNIINKHFKAKIQKENWQYRTIYNTTRSNIGDEYDEDKIYQQLDSKLKEIEKFEAELREKMSLEGY